MKYCAVILIVIIAPVAYADTWVQQHSTPGHFLPSASEVEMTGMRNRNTKVFSTGKAGQFRTAQKLSPVHYKSDPWSATESWKDIDLTINLTPSESWDAAMETNGYQVRFWQNYQGQRYVAQFRRGGKWLAMAPVALAYVNKANQRQIISTIVTGVSPTINNASHTVTWPNAFGSGIHFIYNVQPDHFFKTVKIDNLSDLPTPTINLNELRLVIIMKLKWDLSGAWENYFGVTIVDDELGTGTDPESPDEELESIAADMVLQDATHDFFWMVRPKAWDSDEPTQQINVRWDLRRKGEEVYGLFSIPANVLNSATFPIFIDVSIKEEVPNSAADWEDDSGSFANNTLLLTWGLNDPGNATSGVFYNGVTIFEGATVDSASLAVWFNNREGKGPHYVLIQMEDADSASVPTNDAQAKAIVPTTANYEWYVDPDDVIDKDVWYYTPDLSTIVQEVVNRSGWASENHMQFIFTDGASTSAEEHQPATYDASSVESMEFYCYWTSAWPPPWYILADFNMNFGNDTGGTGLGVGQTEPFDPVLEAMQYIDSSTEYFLATSSPMYQFDMLYYFGNISDATAEANNLMLNHYGRADDLTQNVHMKIYNYAHGVFDYIDWGTSRIALFGSGTQQHWRLPYPNSDYVSDGTMILAVTGQLILNPNDSYYIDAIQLSTVTPVPWYDPFANYMVPTPIPTITGHWFYVHESDDKRRGYESAGLISRSYQERFYFHGLPYPATGVTVNLEGYNNLSFGQDRIMIYNFSSDAFESIEYSSNWIGYNPSADIVHVWNVPTPVANFISSVSSASMVISVSGSGVSSAAESFIDRLWLEEAGEPPTPTSTPTPSPTPIIHVDQPNTGSEQWIIGDIHEIIISVSSTIDSVTLEISDDNKASWVDIAIATSYINAASSYHYWLVDGVDANTNLSFVRVSMPSDAWYDESDNGFSILTPSPTPTPTPMVSVDQPNGGETWVNGDLAEMIYSVSGNDIANVSLEYYNGASWNLIASETTFINAASTYQYWLVSSATTQEASFRVSLVSTWLDISDAVYEIADPTPTPTPKISELTQPVIFVITN